VLCCRPDRARTETACGDRLVSICLTELGQGFFASGAACNHVSCSREQ
jgi:hypothetical protein